MTTSVSKKKYTKPLLKAFKLSVSYTVYTIKKQTNITGVRNNSSTVVKRNQRLTVKK